MNLTITFILSYLIGALFGLLAAKLQNKKRR